MASRMSDLVQSYTSLSTSLLERWSTMASRSASKMDTGNYDAASAAEDAAAGWTLAAEASWLWAAYAFDAFAAFTGFEGGPNISKSRPFVAPAGATLELAGPLSKGAGLAQLAPALVTIQPAQLGPEQESFTLRVDGSTCRGATYAGDVIATVGRTTTLVPVWVTVL
jgi:hypothetical protein